MAPSWSGEGLEAQVSQGYGGVGDGKCHMPRRGLQVVFQSNAMPEFFP